jgi:hypothetical protein
MRPLHEHELSSEIFEVPLPIFEIPKSEVDVRYLANLQCDIYRSGLLKPRLISEIFFDETGMSFIVDFIRLHF